MKLFRNLFILISIANITQLYADNYKIESINGNKATIIKQKLGPSRIFISKKITGDIIDTAHSNKLESNDKCAVFTDNEPEKLCIICQSGKLFKDIYALKESTTDAPTINANYIGSQIVSLSEKQVRISYYNK